MNVLIIASLWPEPTSSAAGRRMIGLLELFIKQDWCLTYACTAGESEYAHPLEQMGVSLKKIAINDESFDTFLAEHAPDIVLYDRFMVEEQFSWRVEKHCPNALTLLETSDLHCLRHARQLALKKGRPLVEEDLFDEVAYREIASIQRTDITLIISSFEMNLLKMVFNVDGALIHYFPFIVNSKEVSDKANAHPTFEDRKGFMCIGNFKHAPNWDSVQYLKQSIWPLIREQLPSAEVCIYGAYVTPKARQLHKPSEGFYIKGRADDVGDVMSSAKVCLAPLRFGAGLKGKLLDAMECGTPSVTSSIGDEGMHEDLPWGGIVADDAETFAAAAVELHEDREKWIQSRQNGDEILKQCYSQEKFEPALINKIVNTKKQLISHRQKNIQGSILKYHMMKSTKYMSLWIEEKNKKENDV